MRVVGVPTDLSSSDGPNLPFCAGGNGNHSAEGVQIIKSKPVCVDLVKSEI
jgi:hypothetical protein